MKLYRVGRSWGVTIVETEPTSPGGEDDRLMATAQSPEDARKIVDALNKAEGQE